MRTLQKPVKGRPAKYYQLLTNMKKGQTIQVWQGSSDRYSMKLAWGINSRRVNIPEGRYSAERLYDPDREEWVVEVTKS